MSKLQRCPFCQCELPAKARATDEYWDEQIKTLLVKDKILFLRLSEYRFARWRPDVIKEAHYLGETLSKITGNPYNYAPSTILRRMKQAQFRYIKLEREERRKAHAANALPKS